MILSNNLCYGQHSLGPGDAQDIVRRAEQVVEDAASSDPAQEITAVIGQATVINPRDGPNYAQPLIHPPITFEWRIVRASKARLAFRIQKWRYTVCGGAIKYRKRESEYKKFLWYHELDDPREGQRTSAMTSGRKRSSEEMAEAQEIRPGSKRQSTDSSQWSSAGSQSSLSSPDLSREPSVAAWSQPTMGPPPPMGAGLQGRGFAPQIPGHGYQGPGQVQQAPAPEGMVEVYGHFQPAEPRRPRGPPRVGIQHTQQFAAHGGWNFQHPGQPQVPVRPAPEQHSYQPGHAGFVDPQSGRGYAGGSGHNMPAFWYSNLQGGGGYPTGFPPTQPAMHGGQFVLPRQPQHGTAVPPEGGHDRSTLQNIERMESPEPLDPTAAQSGQRNSPPSFSSGTQPMYHHHRMPPVRPTATRNIDPAQFQAQPPLPPVGQNYPSSLPPASDPMRAELIRAPEYEDVPADSGSESEGEDDQSYHQDTRVTQPLLHTGGQGDPRMYESPSAMPQDPSYDDVFMGAAASDDDASDEDNFHRR